MCPRQAAPHKPAECYQTGAAEGKRNLYLKWQSRLGECAVMAGGEGGIRTLSPPFKINGLQARIERALNEWPSYLLRGVEPQWT
ncbi:MAG: hypothetical protein Kow0025_20230 [Thermodesulfovibrionales bacterium]